MPRLVQIETWFFFGQFIVAAEITIWNKEAMIWSQIKIGTLKDSKFSFCAEFLFIFQKVFNLVFLILLMFSPCFHFIHFPFFKPCVYKIICIYLYLNYSELNLWYFKYVIMRFNIQSVNPKSREWGGGRGVRNKPCVFS